MIKKYGVCPTCGYELDPYNSYAYIELTDSIETAREKLLEAHYEASPECKNEGEDDE